MEQINLLREPLPDAARDIKINLTNVLTARHAQRRPDLGHRRGHRLRRPPRRADAARCSPTRRPRASKTRCSTTRSAAADPHGHEQRVLPVPPRHREGGVFPEARAPADDAPQAGGHQPGGLRAVLPGGLGGEQLRGLRAVARARGARRRADAPTRCTTRCASRPSSTPRPSRSPVELVNAGLLERAPSWRSPPGSSPASSGASPSAWPATS